MADPNPRGMTVFELGRFIEELEAEKAEMLGEVADPEQVKRRHAWRVRILGGALFASQARNDGFPDDLIQQAARSDPEHEDLFGGDLLEHDGWTLKQGVWRPPPAQKQV